MASFMRPFLQANPLDRLGKLSPKANPMEDPNTMGRPDLYPMPTQREELGAPLMAQPPPPPPPAPETDFLGEYNRIVNARPERDRFKQLMGEAPTREGNRPNKMTAIGAAMSGFATGWKNPAQGSAVAQSIIDRPFNEASDEYEKKLRNVGALAGMESDDVKERLQGLTLQNSNQRDTRDYNQRIREFDARMEELKDRDWEKFSHQESGRMGWTNRKTGQTIYGPQENETLAQARAREDQVDKTKLEGQKSIAQIGVAGRNEVNEAKLQYQRERDLAKAEAAMTKIKYGPMSQTQRAAKLDEKLQNLVSIYKINPYEYIDVNEGGVHTMKEDPGRIARYWMGPEGMDKYESERALVQAALNSGGGIVSPDQTKNPPPGSPNQLPPTSLPLVKKGATPDKNEVLLWDSEAKTNGYVYETDVAKLLAIKKADGSPRFVKR